MPKRCFKKGQNEKFQINKLKYPKESPEFKKGQTVFKKDWKATLSSSSFVICTQLLRVSFKSIRAISILATANGKGHKKLGKGFNKVGKIMRTDFKTKHYFRLSKQCVYYKLPSGLLFVF